MSLQKSLLLPLGVFIALVIMLALGFGLRDPHYLPSVLINKPFPEFELRNLADESRLMTKADLVGGIALVNVWATWCPNCLVEHPELMRIAGEAGEAGEESLPIYGINYNDDAEKARAWLKRHGDAYRFSVVDDKGRLAIDLGVYGAPETFILDAEGVIRFRFVGPVSPSAWQAELLPVIRHLQKNQERP